ncbi:unnamed protein product [Caenorhabditis brenneri]
MDISILKALLYVKISDKDFAPYQEKYDDADSAGKNRVYDAMKPMCDEFFDSKTYKNGDKTYGGYRFCCDMFGMCGPSGWVIFLIIVLVLGVLAGGAAAFWFFYWKRKYGGKEEMVEENTESTEDSKTVIEIPVGNY